MVISFVVVEGASLVVCCSVVDVGHTFSVAIAPVVLVAVGGPVHKMIWQI